MKDLSDTMVFLYFFLIIVTIYLGLWLITELSKISIKWLIKKGGFMKKKIKITMLSDSDLGCIKHTRTWEYEQGDKENPTVVLPSWDAEFNCEVKCNDTFQIEPGDENVQFAKGKGSRAKILTDDSFDYSFLLDYQYQDISDQILLQDQAFEKSRLKDQNEGLWSGIGIREIEINLPEVINWDHLKKISFGWKNWDGDEKISSQKLRAVADKSVTFDKANPHICTYHLDTDLILTDFFENENIISEGIKQARFTGELTLYLENSNWIEEISLPIEIVFRLPEAVTDFVSIDFGTSATCVAIKNGAKAEPLPINMIGDTKDDYESPTALMIYDWDEIYKAWIDNKLMPQLRIGDIKKEGEDGDFTFGNNIKQFLKDSPLTVKELEAILNDLKQTPYLEYIGKLNGFEFRSIRSDDPRRPEIRVVTEPKKQFEDKKSFDPIAFYGYIIGRAINRVSRNQAFVNYRMTMPVKFDQSIIDKILASFKYGLTKSVPLSLKEKVHVDNICTEPVAFLGSVLDEKENDDKDSLSFKENAKNLFAVYDLGGGTLDTACGLWRVIENDDIDQDEELEYKDSVIEIFGLSGDPNLGGEKLINRIASEIYIQNIEMMNQNNIPCPIDAEIEWDQRAKYSNLTISAGRPNKIMLAEKIAREIFYKFDLTKGSFESKLNNLNDIYDKRLSTIQLKINSKPILERIKKEIYDSVYEFRRFIENSITNYHNHLKAKEIDFDMSKVFIYLAGNTCKSIIVKEAFQKHFADCYQDTIAPRINFINDEVSHITPKTMVALGQIKFELNSVALKTMSQYQFAYHLLAIEHNQYKTILKPHYDYSDWVEYDRAKNWGEKEFFFTQHSTPESLELDHSDIKHSRKLHELKGQKGYLYVRPKGISSIEMILIEKRNTKPSKDDEGIVINLEAKE
jgi:hypothetical protein